MGDLTDPRTAADPATAWTALIRRYYEGCSAGDVDLMLGTLHPDVVHWFLAPNTGSTAVTGAEHLARYWRKVAGMLRARWVVDSICATPDQAVVEWTMWWLPEGAARVATRGAEWFTCRDGLIHEIRSYHQLRPETTELDGFPYAARGYSTPGTERSAVHPTADRFGPGPSLPDGTDMTARLTVRADVPTDAPARYAKQLVAHLGHRVDVTTEGDTSTVRIGEGTGRVVVGNGLLTLLAEAPDADALARVQHVLGSHLERFGQRNELTVTWTTGA